MINVRSIVIVSDKHPAKLKTQLEPIKIQDGAGMAVTSICYGEIRKINKNNNKVYFSMTTAEALGLREMREDGRIVEGSTDLTQKINFVVEIPVEDRKYHDIESVVNEIISSVNNELKKRFGSNYRNIASLSLETKRNSQKLTVNPQGIIINYSKLGSPWDLLGISEHNLVFENKHLQDADCEVTFLYANIIENSYINGKKSRNLAVLPLQKRNGYSSLSIVNPIYVPIEVKEFSDIVLELRDLNGELVDIDPNYKTVISLHLKQYK